MAMGQLKGTIAHGGFGGDLTGDGLQHLGGVHLIGVYQRQLPADLQHQRIDPAFQTDLAVLLREDGTVFGGKRIG
jgi:hypothetical protein